ncbi:alpha-2-macroglobulin family protein [Rugamonas sp. DEMB1]|uniref:alpha-2-macroglobulin family protein n=1 Tax=Rugamonas sp. DEMB1 TaxID=3039386 RepID=UPI00244AA091|nr:MG2 domain-containing protein [Rugamonas sp. DEMB1]WGG52000.1 MG2 domain-containing protein [Rugamonas sp. DEMB1]
MSQSPQARTALFSRFPHVPHVPLVRRLTPLLAALALLCAHAPAAQAQAKPQPPAVPAPAAPASVESFSPSGTVKQVRQVQARFSAQMVAFGDLRLDAPFSVDCPEQGSGRWIDGRNWSYDFVRDLPAGVSCSFTLKAGLRDLAGADLAGSRKFSFNTGGPAIVESLPREGGEVDEQQIFVLGLDAPARAADVEAQAYCRADGINEKIPVRRLVGAEREQILAQRKQFVDRYLNLYFRARGVVWRASVGVRDKRLAQMPLELLQCRRSLPAKAKVALVWGAGIASESGIANQKDQVLAYRTRPDFTATFSCDRPSAKGDCIPFLPARLNFSAPVRLADALAVRLGAPGGKSFRASVGDDEKKAEFVSGVSIVGPFPEQAKLTLTLPANLKDDAGRPLLNHARFPLTVRTGPQPPLVKFPARFGVIEARGDRLLPVTVRNVEAGLPTQLAKVSGSAVGGAMLRVADQQDQQIIDWLKRLTGRTGGGWQPGELYGQDLYQPMLAGHKDGAVERFTLPKPGGKRAFEVIGIPLRKPGFYVVELASPLLGGALSGKPRTAYVNAAALVTNLVAHFKHGAESSLVWVTSLDKGRPVAGAKVAVRDCAGKPLWQGSTDANGVANIRQELARFSCGYNDSYFISARSGADMTFTLSDWNRGIEAWRFNLPTDDVRADNTIAATVFDRTLLRAGETVHMKHFLRRHVAAGLALAGAGKAPDKMFILHEGSEQRYELPLSWRHGAADNSWPIPAEAKQGWYSVLLDGRMAGRFRVEQFRVPTMKALLQGPKTPAVLAAKLDLDVQLSYLSGGAAAGAPVKLRTVIEPHAASFPDYDGFSFGAGDVKAGVEKSGAVFDDDEGMFEEEGERSANGNDAGTDADADADAPKSGAVRTRSLTLDGAGGARVSIDQLPQAATPRNLLAELSYQDANGETLSVATRIPLWPSSYQIGIAPDGWVLSKDALKFQVVVLDLQGRPVADAPVSVDLFQRMNYSHRRRLIGGFYAYENSSEVKALGAACEGRTDKRGLLLCQTKAAASGNLILRARTEDVAHHAATTHIDTWVADGDDWWFKASDNDRIDLLPEKKRYEPGQQASFQVRMPFRQATALVTVEREGVIDSYVRALSGKAPTFSIPIKAQYAPNVYVSALVVRGRVAGAAPTALVDLGKPAYKLGITPLRVGWAGNELKVQVSADKAVYKVREKANVAVRVTRADGSPVPAGAEVALAAVDVGLLELMPNASWELLEAMMQQRSLQVQTATAQMQVVGKRHFGRKAVAPGGGGGKGGGRELFDTLLFWQARVALDGKGEATVQVPLNDSLTAFRIVAIASANADLFGTGKTEVRSSQDLMLLSGLPALVREGDRFQAGFTLRNTSDAEMQVELAASAAGKALPAQKLTLAAGQAREVGWDYQVPLGLDKLAWDVSAKVVGADSAGDRLRVKQTVKPAVPVQTIQATLLQLDGPQSMQVRMPADAQPGRGGLRTLFSARLGSDLPGVREYMTMYPYTCFEQNTSRAIALRDAAMWERQAASLPAHMDSDGLVKYFSLMERGSDSLTAYVLSAVQEAGYPIPPELKGRMEEALLGFVHGRVLRNSALATADLAVRKLAALEALSRSGRVGDAELESFSLEPNLWPTSAVIDWYLILQRSPKLAQRDTRMAQAQQILRARLNLQGTTMTFSTERSDNWWWLMSSADANANRLLLAMADNPAWRADMGRLARGSLGRQRRGHWDTTVANAWGVLALDAFSRKFEATPVTGAASASVGGVSASATLDAAHPTASVMLPWPRGAADLAFKHGGAGKPWVTVQSLAAIPLKAALNTGYRISKTITPVEQKTPGVWSRGDVYRVHLDLEAQSDMTWVVVDDPIPASASVLGTGLGRDSSIATSGERQRGWVWPAFQERSFEAFRSYYEFVPKGKWSVEYTVRLNNAGQFNLPPTRVEAMYSPEMFGLLPNAALGVK